MTSAPQFPLTQPLEPTSAGRLATWLTSASATADRHLLKSGVQRLRKATCLPAPPLTRVEGPWTHGRGPTAPDVVRKALSGVLAGERCRPGGEAR